MEFRCCEGKYADAACITRAYSFLRAIADPNRLQIICILRKGKKCGSELVPILGISEKLVSHHLRQLRNIGLLDEERERNFIHYSLNKKMMREYKKIFNQLIK
jgi:ArsR family transcriptional regulator